MVSNLKLTYSKAQTWNFICVRTHEDNSVLPVTRTPICLMCDGASFEEVRYPIEGPVLKGETKRLNLGAEVVCDEEGLRMSIG